MARQGKTVGIEQNRQKEQRLYFDGTGKENKANKGEEANGDGCN